MSFSSRSSRLSIYSLFLTLSLACGAQQQFVGVPPVRATGGRVTSFVAAPVQYPPGLSDMVWVNAPVGSGTSTSITVGELLNQNGAGFQNLPENQITFTNVSNVVAALGDFNNDNIIDYAFALTPTVAGGPNLCVYYGTGATVGSGVSSYSGSSAYPPISKNGCMTFAVAGTSPPNFSYIAALRFKTGFPPQLVVEDSANGYLYVFANNTLAGNNGTLPGFSLIHTYAIPPADGAGPIYVGDFNHDGNLDLIINGQRGLSASVYFGDGNGGFLVPTPQNRYIFDHNVHSMLMQDMDRDGIADMVVEGDNGVIEIFKGSANGTFITTSVGGTLPGVDGFSGHGGHLAAINPSTLDILTTTPIGLSVLQGNGTLAYFLKSIYNIGPGRSSFALENFFGSGLVDLAVDSPEGVAIGRADPNGDGGFQTSNAYPTLAPALGATVGKFRSAANNPRGNLDVAVSTAAVQGALLQGNGDGTFLSPSVTNPLISLMANPPPASQWSNILTGDFNGDGVADIAYSVTGYPTPGSGLTAPGSNPGLYVQLGKGDGTFLLPQALAGASSDATLYGESAVGDFNGDGLADLANSDWRYEDVLLAQSGGGFNASVLQGVANPGFAPVATGFLKHGRTNKQDVVVASSGGLYVYVNNNGSGFTPMPKILTAIAPSTLLLTDMDGDGNGDIVLLTQVTNEGSKPNQMLIWWGNGDGTFAAAPSIYSLSRNFYLGAAADMNGDGLPDMVLSDGSLVAILYNQGGRAFGGEQHYLAGQGINSISLADVNGDGEPDVIVANGGVTNANAITQVDDLGLTGQSSLALAANPDVNTGGITVLIDSISSKPVTGTLVATPEPSSFGAAFTLTATLFSSPGVPEPSGTIQFYINGTAVGATGPVSPGASSSTASYTVPASNGYQAGTYTLSAVYSGDQLNSPYTLSGTHQITGGATTTVLYLCIGPTVTCPSVGAPTVPNPPYPTSLQMSYGQTWNGTWMVTDTDGGPLPGNFELFDLYNGTSTTLCNVTNIAPSACPPAVGVTLGTGIGVNVLTGQYSGDASHTPSTSAPVTITVLADTTTATLAGAPNPSPFGQPVTFTATLTGNAAAPIGPVSFFQVLPGGTQTLLGTVNLTAGTGFTSTATLVTSTLPIGTDSIQAVYPPTTNFGAAASSVITETITPPIGGSFTLTLSPTAAAVGVGTNGIITVTVTPLNGFSQNVNLTCSNLPYEAACLFALPTIAGGNGTSTLYIETTAPHSCNANQPYFLGNNGGGGSGVVPIALPALAGLVLMFIPGKRRWLRALIAVAVVAGATHLTGCGNCTDLGTRPNAYTITVTGTAADSSAAESAPVTITVFI